jgi:peptide/nickel transport system substrate-binding protein
LGLAGHEQPGTYSAYLGIGTKYDQPIQQGISTLDPTKRQEIYNQLQKLAYDDAIAIFLDQALGRHYERTWVGGYYYNPLHPLDLYPLYKAADAQPDRKLIGEQHLTVLQW